MDSLFFTYFSVSATISTSFALMGALFLLTIPNKSKATLYIGLVFLVLTFGNLAYFFSASFYTPFTAYHRYFAIFFVPQAITLMAQFFFHYPERRHPKFAAFVFALDFLAISFVTVLFIIKTQNVDLFFRFDANYWDFAEYDLSRKIALVIIGVLFTCVVAAVMQIIQSRGRDRWVVSGLFLTFLAGSLVPAIANSLAHQGVIDRGVYVLLYNIFVVLGFSLMVILYINNTSDSSTFLAKLVGVSVVVFLLVMQGVSYFNFLDIESSYNAVRERDTRIAVREKEMHKDLKYLAELNADGSVRLLHGDKLATRGYEEELISALTYELAVRPAQKNKAEAILNSGRHEFLVPYGEVLRRGGTPEEVAGAIQKINRSLLQSADKIRVIDDEKLRAELPALLEKQTSLPAAFQKDVAEFLSKNTDLPPKELKNAVLRLFTPMQPASVRRYRQDAEGDHFIAFLFFDPTAEKIYEAGYDYTSYRKAFHTSANRQMILLGCVLLVVLGGFRFFFMGILVSPLERLLGGVRKVNAGDLDVELPVRVEDEIGFLSRSFNAMVASIKDGRMKLQEYASQLEEKVLERTNDLKTTLEEVQALKVQQDGDYFLTARLLKPLGANTADSENVGIDVFIKQKKQFHFKHWADEIGGDMCLSDSIRLQDRKYVFFSNADAMGKSMQGAGGALVLGSVLRSIVERTKLADAVNLQSPERWLKNAFLELQKVFESFDGSMLVSMILGLVDDEAGLLYYMNAEHPHAVLYRSGAASFVDDRSMFRKLGTPVEEGRLSVSTFQMHPGDVVLLGSDGRDDILLSEGSDGRVVNQDESMFVRRVEESGGSLDRIVDSLLNGGELTDDLSLMRISFREDGPLPAARTPEVGKTLKECGIALRKGRLDDAAAALSRASELAPLDPFVWKYRARLAFRRGEFQEAGEAALMFLQSHPSDTRSLYAAAYCLRKTGDYARAADLGERLRLREPENVRNLRNLAVIHLATGHVERAREIVGEVQKIDSSDRVARQILERIGHLNN